MTTKHNLLLPKEPVSAKSWALDLGVTIAFISHCVDVSEDGLDNRDFNLTESQQTRLLIIKRILQRIEKWFDTRQEAVSWFDTCRLESSGDFTPLEIVKQHGEDGEQVVLTFIAQKELGGFE
ncbi:hypothetical protein BM528_15665 [Alteromonas sp. RW2A1]|uniref:hypothetical protein n=1 Tax=Alteromonas sp. RW2A1 TaxID=1917158 RepID=UPI000903EACC|nr:hypothetical protein [Alteromonas sp. RW2A1]APE07039.1 hypothetical protein BM528_15665 [Alteromonas sp. RW2A1]